MIVELVEHQSTYFEKDALPAEAMERLFANYRKKVSIDWPSPKTKGAWRLKSEGWAGFIPLGPDFGVALRPKTPVGNLFRMLEYAYDLKSFQFLPDLANASTLEEFYERLANRLALDVLARGRKGFYRAYEPHDERTAFVRGRLDVADLMRRPWEPNPRCRYEEHTPDTESNRILAWTLFVIARAAIGRDEARRNVRLAFRQIVGLVTLEPVPATACVGRIYTRLDQEYRRLHALCRFFLEHSGPTHEAGDRAALPFLVDMSRLFERFVAAWLEAHLPPEFRLGAQESFVASREAGITFVMDLVLYDRATNRAVAVLDTKYKTAGSMAESDFYQIVTYAKARECANAILIYPAELEKPADVTLQEIRVRGLAFSLDGDLEWAGARFLGQLLACVG